MEYKLNKIDMELRMKINEATKEGRVHGKTDLKDSNINKESDNQIEEMNINEKKAFKNLKMYPDGKKRLYVEAEKIESLQVEVDRKVDEKEFLNKGIVLDIRK